MKASSFASLALFLATGALILNMNNVQAKLDTDSENTSSQVLKTAPSLAPKKASVINEKNLEHETEIPQLRLTLSSPETESHYNMPLVEGVSETETTLVTIRGTSTKRTAERQVKP